MAAFTHHITKPTGDVPQIGDNDNGRFFKFDPVFKQQGAQLAEQFLNRQHLLNAIDTLFGEAPQGVDGHLIAGLCDSLSMPDTTPRPSGYKPAFEEWMARLRKIPSHRVTITIPPVDQSLELIAYPDFGIYVFKSPRLYLAIRCGSIGQNGRGGHAHLDQLHIELQIDKRDVIVDNGTCVYTPAPELRNQYRASAAHFVPRVAGQEAGDLHQGLFVLAAKATECLYFGEHGFIGITHAYDMPVYRVVSFQGDSLLIEDFSESARLQAPSFSQVPYSPAYGLPKF
jgi:hypothetical protein